MKFKKKALFLIVLVLILIIIVFIGWKTPLLKKVHDNFVFDTSNKLIVVNNMNLLIFYDSPIMICNNFDEYKELQNIIEYSNERASLRDDKIKQFTDLRNELNNYLSTSSAYLTEDYVTLWNERMLKIEQTISKLEQDKNDIEVERLNAPGLMEKVLRNSCRFLNQTK